VVKYIQFKVGPKLLIQISQHWTSFTKSGVEDWPAQTCLDLNPYWTHFWTDGRPLFNISAWPHWCSCLAEHFICRKHSKKY